MSKIIFSLSVENERADAGWDRRILSRKTKMSDANRDRGGKKICSGNHKQANRVTQPCQSAREYFLFFT